ncbi:pseudouridine-5'-phosphate glycosidase [Thermus antranikianii]|uniref:Pseudouridine-5'-phosphate glycosidase n=1 Tax=Thermus antranikianii TaxID=88190 RepID=A0ABY7RQ36_9DEIN|nr:pseudouridine-5'-phosphate glycosidase [Thermus antranikianii]QWK21823.1 MAG: pseudouridine-5'-phosphate glycosidase [Thermus antranikianii]WCM39458.1 pseudouridine-5-phosphate glycosidase [Thermus antranikianii]
MAEALVALESAFLTHGLPYPLNLRTAKALEEAVRAEGAIPKTIALVQGEVRVGLSQEEMEALAQGGAEKASLWNLPALLVQRKSAGTTVAATVHLAYRHGIAVFATGGIGGVHPEPFDESADLLALARTPILVVSSGPKAILDLRATLERLETLGVSVVGYRTDRLPAFFSPSSPFPVPARVETPLEAALVLRKSRELGLGAVLLVNPVSQGLPYEEVVLWVEEASHQAAREGVFGKALTPYLLRRLSELSRGETDRVNERLLLENARLAARVALAWAGLE